MFKKYILPIILAGAAVALFFTLTNPMYADMQQIQQESSQYEQALERSRELIRIRDQLLSQYNDMETSNLERLERMLPDHIDNVRLIIELDRIAAQHDMELQEVSLEGTEGTASNVAEAANQQQNPYKKRQISFLVGGSYQNLLSFLADVERSSRIVDVSSFSLDPAQEGSSGYSITVTTYWLPQDNVSES